MNVNKNIFLVITTINKVNKNILEFSKNTKKNLWNFIVVGDKKTPVNYKINYGNFLSYNSQKKLKYKFSKICPANNYARKNIGYLFAIEKKSRVIVETDDDNFPKKNFFSRINLKYTVRELLNKSWVNVYLNFLYKKKEIWPRGLSLNYTHEYPKLSKYFKTSNFYLQQGVCEGNPDVDAIFRLANKNISIKFKNNFKYSLGSAISPFNSQNTIWFKKIFPLLYLPVTCSMRCTDIWRSFVDLNILGQNSKKVLFFGTTMFQKRNDHNLVNDLLQEIPLYSQSEEIVAVLKKIKLRNGDRYYCENLILSYQTLINKGFINPEELKFLRCWISDYKKLI